MTDNMAKLAHIAGVYKGVQSAGAAGAFGVNLRKDNTGKSFMAQLGVPWALCGAGEICLLPIVVYHIPRRKAELCWRASKLMMT